MKQISVGVGYENYAVERVISNKVTGVKYFANYDINTVKASVLQKTALSGQDYKQIFNPTISFPKTVDLYHFFNVICLQKNVKRPWITSFETVVPRLSLLLGEHKIKYPDYNKFKKVIESDRHLLGCLENIASRGCFNLIALSANALQIQNDFFGAIDFFNRFDKDKIISLLPPQKLLFDGYRTFGGNEIRFLFVGRDFFRKGGYEALTALVTLRRHHKLPIRFTIVGSIKQEWFGNTHSDQIKDTYRILDENKDWIIHYPSLPNKIVLELMKNADVGLLPTWSDSFGYSILEMQACGLPVITTDVRAIPEINSDLCGWIINMPKNRFGELLEVKSKRSEISQMIYDGLVSIIMNIFGQPSVISLKAEASLARIKQFHDPDKYGMQLKSIYQRALNYNIR